MKHLCKLFVVLLILSCCQIGDAGLVTLQDSTLDDSSWQTRTLISSQGPTGGALSQQLVNDWYGVGFYRSISVNFPSVSYPSVQSSMLAIIYVEQEYNVQKSGAIKSIEWSLDFNTSVFGDIFAEFYIVLEQDDKYYASRICCTHVLNYQHGWATATDGPINLEVPTHVGLKQQDFYQVKSALRSDDWNAFPDFSSNGSPIEFGFVFDIQTRSKSLNRSGAVLVVDNFVINITSVPEASSTLILSIAGVLVCTPIRRTRLMPIV